MPLRTKVLAAIALTLATGVGIWLYARTTSMTHVASETEVTAARAVPKISSKDYDFQALEDLSLAACRCEQEGGTFDTCRAPYEREVEKLVAAIGMGEEGREGVASASEPVSFGNDCFQFSDGEQCVADYTLTFTLDGRGNVALCTVDEADAVEEVYKGHFTDAERSASAAGSRNSLDVKMQCVLDAIQSRTDKTEPLAIENCG